MRNKNVKYQRDECHIQIFNYDLWFSKGLQQWPSHYRNITLDFFSVVWGIYDIHVIVGVHCTRLEVIGYRDMDTFLIVFWVAGQDSTQDLPNAKLVW
jgi:hypothetical protein